ncbi:unnamed protein product [Nesidiocoris tenuis]|uniref:Uncharacterized protein n=1 Tax=Nesidiocoris tenuis TaxID=355587 RepID=A0A6H5H3R8_9HEMI|nr:unnamed protein product [Nesidiocoris tenuis]
MDQARRMIIFCLPHVLRERRPAKQKQNPGLLVGFSPGNRGCPGSALPPSWRGSVLDRSCQLLYSKIQSPLFVAAREQKIQRKICVKRIVYSNQNDRWTQRHLFSNFPMHAACHKSAQSRLRGRRDRLDFIPAEWRLRKPAQSSTRILGDLTVMFGAIKSNYQIHVPISGSALLVPDRLTAPILQIRNRIFLFQIIRNHSRPTPSRSNTGFCCMPPTPSSLVMLSLSHHCHALKDHECSSFFPHRARNHLPVHTINISNVDALTS